VSILNMKLHFTTFSMHRLLFLYAKLNHKVGLLSIEKQDRENYLFEDYCLKSGIKIWILALRISGRSKRNIPLPVFQNEPKRIIIEYTYLSSMAR
jgi:hypothetical protein